MTIGEPGRPEMSKQSRREFVQTSALLAAGAALPLRSWQRVLGANGDIRVAVIGLNGRGRNHLSSLAKIPGVRVVALCDVDTAVLDKVKPTVNGGADVKTYVDMREVFASPDIDAVTIATPNHWHSLAAIWALQAGKDVYLEKPVSHNIWEGRQLVAAAKKHNRRVIQAGTQIRSGEGLREAVQWVRDGNLGKVTASRGFCYKRRDSLGLCGGPQQVPSTINYDLWSGPREVVPPRRNTKNGPVHYDWHWFWAYGNGDIGNQGIHQMDVARWFLGDPGFPKGALSVGGRLGYADDGQTPNTQAVMFDYDAAPLIFEVRGLPASAGLAGTGVDPRENADSAGMDKYRGVAIGNVVDCEGGSMIVPSYTSATAVDRSGRVIKEFRGRDQHMENFIDVVRSRKSSDLYGPIEQAAVSSALCHLGNISHRLGQSAPQAEVRDLVRSSWAMHDADARMIEHLRANNVDLDATPLTRGIPLLIDARNQRFTGPDAERANRMLREAYRASFAVPSLLMP
jgi:predicted dehydrogenase